MHKSHFDLFVVILNVWEPKGRNIVWSFIKLCFTHNKAFPLRERKQTKIKPKQKFPDYITQNEHPLLAMFGIMSISDFRYLWILEHVHIHNKVFPNGTEV
jgi:hypothetical protein